MATPTSEAVQSFLNEMRRTAKDKEYFAWAVQARKQYAALRLREDMEIRKLYQQVARKIGKQLKGLAGDEATQLADLRKSLLGAMRDLSSDMTGLLESYTATAADAGTIHAAGVLSTVAKKAGGKVAARITSAGIEVMRSRVNRAAVEAIWSRSTNGLFLSERIWGTSQTSLRAVADIIRESVVVGYDAVDTSRMLEAYVLDGAKTVASRYPKMQERMNSWWPRGMTFQEAKAKGLLKPGRVRVPNDVCYEALRLARTETTAALGEATTSSARMVPGYEGMRWILSNSHPEQDICDSYSHVDFGLGKGVFPPGDEPHLPAHPNCICSLIAAMQDTDAFVERLRGWVDNPDSDQELELWHRRVYRGLPEEQALSGLDLTRGERRRAEKLGWVSPGSEQGDEGDGEGMAPPVAPVVPAVPPQKTKRDVADAFPDTVVTGHSAPGASLRPNNVIENGRKVLDQYQNEYREIAIELSGDLKKITLATDDDGFFRRNDNLIHIGKRWQQLDGYSDPTGYGFEYLFTHEYGHFVDYELQRRVAQGAIQYDHISSLLSIAIDADAKELAQVDVGNTVQQLIGADSSLSNCPGLSDVFSAITKQQISGYYGHSSSYWNRPGSRSKEVFANLFDLYSRGMTDQISFLRTHCPETISAFEYLVVDVAEKVL